MILGKKILIADDEFLIRWSLSEALSQDGYEVMAVGDGEKALEAIRIVGFDFIITDLVMPGIDGWEVLDRVKEIYPGAKVVIITAHGDRETGVMARERGAYGYIEKPELIDKIRVLVRGGFPDDCDHGMLN